MPSEENGWDETIDPMGKAYRNPRFNRYDDGPGAELDDDLQPGAIAAEPTVARTIDVHLAKVPVDFTEQGIRNMCAKYGQIVYVKRNINTNWAIVKYDSLSAAENAIQDLSNNNMLNISASFAKKRVRSENHQEMRFDQTPQDRPNEKRIDWNRREIVAPFGSPLRIEAKQLPPNLNQSDYDQVPFLRRVDPHMDFIHSDSTHLNNRPSVYNGTHVYKESDEVMENIKKRALKSGGYHGKNVYTYPSASTQLNSAVTYKLGSCNKCGLETHLSCSRCADFYCSVSCQKQDWREHRRVCMPMPDLVLSPVIPNAAKELPNHPTNLKPAARANGTLSNNNLDAPVKDMSNMKLEYPKKSAQAISHNGRDNNKPAPPKLTKKPLDADVKIANKVVKPAPTFELSPPPANNSKVMMTYIHNHRCVFIRSMESTDNLNYLKVLNNCAEYEKISEPMSVLPAKGDVVLAKFVGIYYRALVIKVNNDNDIKVGFLDFGNSEKTKLSELKHLSKDLQKHRRYNFRVILDGVGEKLTNDGVMNYLNGLVDDSKVLKLLYDDTKPLKDNSIRLIDTVTGENINDCVIDLNRVNVVPLNAVPIGLDALEKVDISGENVELVVLNNSHLCINTLSCVRQEDLKELVDNCQRFQEYCQQVKDTYTPRLFELCLAFSGDVWNRGQCIELAGDGNPCILFIDDGNMQPVSIENIRKMPTDFTHRCVTVDCIIDGLGDEISDEDLKRLQSLLIIGSTLIAKNARKIDSKSSKDEFLIQIPDILEAMQDVDI